MRIYTVTVYDRYGYEDEIIFMSLDEQKAVEFYNSYNIEKYGKFGKAIGSYEMDVDLTNCLMELGYENDERYIAINWERTDGATKDGIVTKV